MTIKLRRLVTGLDENGKSTVIFDSEPPVRLQTDARPGHTMLGLWETRSTPAKNEHNDEAFDHEFRLLPPQNGTHCISVIYPPEDKEVLASVDRQAAFGSMQAAPMLVPDEDATHPYMHATPTVDYVFVLSGEIVLILENEEVFLKQGDCVIQRETVHAWSNRGTEPCLLVGVMVDAGVS